MAKKGAKGSREKAVENRYGDVSPEKLEEFAEAVSKLTGRFRSAARIMAEAKMPTVRIDGYSKFETGKKAIRDFLNNTEHALKKQGLDV